ncbi:hypothetical protein [Vibrio kanaloae]|uniref:hypothetical protein n=1 Tax=Vibrio kanaloae TaxID=170673 RepID=UPI001EFC6BF1|nr:hypothetical protein [Vibrio kanaloae]MCG9559365.1 hypothetical protein [Vibrio kanaloae]
MYFLLVLATVIQLSTLLRTPFYNYFEKLDYSIYLYSTVDTLLTALIFYILWYVSSKNIKHYIEAWSNVDRISNSLLLFTAIIFLYTSYLAFSSIGYILAGATRQALITEHNTFGFGYLFVSSYFKILFPIFLITKVNIRYKVIFAIGFLLSMLITASRNEMIYAGYLIATIFLIKDLRRGIRTVAIVFAVFIGLAFLLTIVQGRPVGESLLSVFNVFDKHVLYRSYSLYLSERVTTMPLELDKMFYPFFGYISDKVLSIFSLVNVSIGNSFVSHYEFLGYDKATGNYYYANVLYPWWSWFVLAFGSIGLLIKSVFIFAIFYFFVRFKMLITYLYLVSIILFSSPFYTPLITIGGIISLAITIAFDFVIRKDVYRV